MSFLKGVDRVLAPLVWLAAGLLVLMLFIGPQVIAEDEPAPAPAGPATAAPDGSALFVENCGGCHTLAAAGTSGSIGPVLDGAGLDAAFVAETVSSGQGGMPAFSGSLDQAEIDAVAAFVAGSSAP